MTCFSELVVLSVAKLAGVFVAAASSPRSRFFFSRLQVVTLSSEVGTWIAVFIKVSSKLYVLPY